jgi:Zn-finger nucleic acid-binding protein
MEKRAERGVLLDHCPPCNAVWLDGGELEALEVGLARSERELEVQREAESAREQARSVSAIGLCPHCQRALEPHGVHGVEVDRCRRCGGIFFDHGELGAVLGRSRTQLSRLRRTRGEG